MSKYVVNCTWDDVPHIPQEEKEKLYESLAPHERDARSKGVPSIGSGRIYPISESEILVDPFQIPNHWPRVYGFDPGYNKTAAVWAAIDDDSDTIYLYSEHYRGKCEPSIHADSIKARGSWMMGAADWAGIRDDGRKIIDMYRDDFELNLIAADKSVEVGLQKVWQRMSSGRLKVFRNLTNWTAEFRLYRRDQNGRIVKSNDHLMDATRYVIMSGANIAQSPIDREELEDEFYNSSTYHDGRDGITGY